MNERLPVASERKLRYAGPNYAADAVIIDTTEGKIRLIKRSDTGDWALPGGFVDPTDSSACDAAMRETAEEANIVLEEPGPLVFRGKVDDPRNNTEAWIETSAYLFSAKSSGDTLAGDDATESKWWEVDDMPPLYASHLSLVERGLDYLDGKQLVDTALHAETIAPISGGYMKYGKLMAKGSQGSVFIKRCDPEKDTMLYDYLEKEAYTMAHLRQHGFSQIPSKSVLYKDSLMMEALRREDGWKWRAEPDTLVAYINDALETFSRLESIPLPADTSPIEPSVISFASEGWLAFDAATSEKLFLRAESFLRRLTPERQADATRMLTDLESLRETGTAPYLPTNYVLSHHDVRQDNLAWHPDQGCKVVDWSWAGAGEPGSDATSLLIDLHNTGYDVTDYLERINTRHCLTLIGFWLAHSTWPCRGDDMLRFEQFSSAVSAYALLTQTPDIDKS